MLKKEIKSFITLNSKNVQKNNCIIINYIQNTQEDIYIIRNICYTLVDFI